MTRTEELAIDVAAAYRLTRLVTRDSLTKETRARLIRWSFFRAEHTLDLGADPETAAKLEADPPKLAALLVCPWCAGMWCSLAVVVARRMFPRWWSPLARALALSTAVGLISHAD